MASSVIITNISEKSDLKTEGLLFFGLRCPLNPVRFSIQLILQQIEATKLSDQNWIIEIFASIDDKNIEKFSSFLSDDCSFRFGNFPAVHGIDGIGEFVGGFFDSIASLKHDIADIWTIPDGAVCHGSVSYIRHDNSVLSVPFSNIFKTSNDKVNEYLIFADTSQLYT
jgi:hypothetical protein